MTDEVCKHLEAVLFVPFLIKTSDGKQYRVRHSDYVAISPKGRGVVVLADEGGLDHAQRAAHGRRGAAALPDADR